MLIHIGLPKCASTWLQKGYFCNPGSGFYHDESSRLELFRSILPQDSPYYYPDHCAETVDEKILKPADKHDLYPVWSNELLSGWPTYGSFSREIIAQRLSTLFPEAKILIVIREQKALIKSIYYQYIREGGTLPIGQYISKQWVAPFFHGFNMDQFDYKKLLDVYQSLFSTDQVLMLPYELLKENPIEFIQKIQIFTGVKTNWSPKFDQYKNKAPSPAYLWLMRRLNRVIVKRISMSNQTALAHHGVAKVHDYLSLPSFLNGPIGKTIESRITQEVGLYFAESNRQLERKTKLNLERFNYPMDSM